MRFNRSPSGLRPNTPELVNMVAEIVVSPPATEALIKVLLPIFMGTGMVGYVVKLLRTLCLVYTHQYKKCLLAPEPV